MMRRSVLPLLLLLALPPAVSAQRVHVDARISPATGRVGDVVILDVTVVTSGPAPESIQTPSLPGGLRLTGSNDFTEYEFRLPGGRVRTTRRELTLTTVAPGHYVIPPLAIRVDGATYRTRPLRLDVAAAYAGPAGNVGETASGPDDEVLLQSWATPDTVWVGQQVTVRADALFAADLRSRLAGAPQYEGAGGPGFWVYDLGSSTEPQLRPVRGRMYEVQTFRRAFFPLSAGRFLLPGARLAYAVRRGFLSGPESYDLHSDSMPVVVRALPTAGRPDGFAGAVGQYSATLRIDPARVAAGEATTLTLEVRGDGNIKAVPPPPLPALAGVQVFTPTEDAELRPDEEQVGGVKRFTWVLVPSHAGAVTIPPMELDYFNPANGHYEIARTEALGLSVGAAVAGRSGGGGAGAGARTAAAALRPLREHDQGAGAAAWVRAPAFRALAALPVVALLALGLEGVVRRRRRARPAVRPRGGSGMLERLHRDAAALRARAGAESAGADTRLEEELLAFIGSWLSERLGEPELQTMGSSRLDGALREAAVRPVVAVAIAGLVGELEVARYRPVPPSPAQRECWVVEAERLLAEVHAGASARRRKVPSGSAAPLLLLALAGLAGGALAGLAPTGGAAQSAPIRVDVAGADSGGARAAQFAAAVAAYGHGHYAQAADLFAAYAAEQPSHADAWYDLGNSAMRAGQRGRATWAWLRALALRPRDGDVRQNLALAGVDPAIVDAATPPVALSRDELWLSAGLAWLLGAALLLGWRMARRKGLALAGGIALVLAATLGGMAAYSATAPRRAVVLDGVALLGAPHEHADALGEVAEGSTVELMGREGGWVHVRAAVPAGTSSEAREGWIEEGRLGEL